ncbi:cation transporter [Eubacterium sp. MSJ-13]|uniref:heavy-metal-associated domain-containing protein n=1 Tax=Eubacterium sp. MSJ-13 TaxID=2841513 RepID=UPI001C1064D2|nr:cation transporter [Eubacterium sp. MSJ-13]MBU5479219.1 cation transporter [Eubacterium sp. MSJ-13]
MIANIVIVAIIIVICAIGLKSTIAHSKGEGGCCGGSSQTLEDEPQKLEKVVSVKSIGIEGMKCDNCRIRVQNKLNAVPDVNAKVNLKKAEAIVKLGSNVPDEKLIEAVEASGYKVSGITVKG